MNLRVAILAHSTNPRGGVVHALELGDALERLGHEAVVHAPDPKRTGFFRRTRCRTVGVPASGRAGGADTHTLVEARVADYLAYFAEPARRRFDVFHAQDGISGNALATLKAEGLVSDVFRTVHHIDSFADPRLAALQERSIVTADAHCTVSPLWRDELAERFGLAATVVGNGVDLARFSERAEPGDLILRSRLGLMAGPVYLAVGGVEARKNTLTLLDAFAQVYRMRPGAQLVIAGGSSLLNHDDYQARFARRLAASGLPAHAVVVTGPVPDADMPGLYRNADALVFPSVKEGFGLVVLEAMASGLPVITSAIAPFTDYLGETDVVWCTPDQASSVADAMMLALLPALRGALAARGRCVAARHGWDAVARTHLGCYAARGALSLA